jgi:4'-phosphopantetheinyl transferase
VRFLQPDMVLARLATVRAERDVIHVWPFELAGSEASRAQCERFLSAAELERARRFFHEHHRVAFTFAHGLMRHVLGAYCNERPERLAFVAGEHGKPALALAPDAAPIAFNLSHSHGRALLAVTIGREVGVDIEREDPKTNALGIASSYFFGSEFEAIRTAPEAQRRATFFRFWAAKEAVLKAQGCGLHAPLDSFGVIFAPDRASARVESRDAARIMSGWFVRRLDCEPGWHAAVAAHSTDWQARVIEEP